jgi:hypothetical protein
MLVHTLLGVSETNTLKLPYLSIFCGLDMFVQAKFWIGNCMNEFSQLYFICGFIEFLSGVPLLILIYQTLPFTACS